MRKTTTFDAAVGGVSSTTKKEKPHKDTTMVEITTPCGGGRADAPGFTAVKHELYLLLKHWHREALDYEFVEQYVMNQASSLNSRLRDYAYDRIDAIVSVLGRKLAQRASAEVEAGFCTEYPSEWPLFAQGIPLRRDRHGYALPDDKQPKPGVRTKKPKPRKAA